MAEQMAEQMAAEQVKKIAAEAVAKAAAEAAAKAEAEAEAKAAKAEAEAEVKATAKAETASRQRTFYELVQDGDMALERAAKKVGMSPAVFIARMAEAGFSVPAGA